MDRSATARQARLVGAPGSKGGVDKDGGGFALPPVLQTILEYLLDQRSATTTEIRDLVAKCQYWQPHRIRHVYRNEGDEPIVCFTADLLDQLEYKNLIQGIDDTRWELGMNFKPNVPLEILPRDATSVIVRDTATRALGARLAQDSRKLTIMLNQLKPDGPGWRKLDEARVNELAASMHELGYMRAFPVIADHEGRILSGRHRLEAARRAGVANQEQACRVVLKEDEISDLDAFAIAWEANNSKGWTPAQQASILKNAGFEDAETILWGHTGARERITNELLFDAARSDREVARSAGASHPTVASIRAELEQTGKIFQFTPELGGKGKTTRKPASPDDRPVRARPSHRKVTDAIEDQLLAEKEAGTSEADLAQRHSLSRSTVYNSIRMAKARRTAAATVPADAPVEMEPSSAPASVPVVCRCPNCGHEHTLAE